MSICTSTDIQHLLQLDDIIKHVNSEWQVALLQQAPAGCAAEEQESELQEASTLRGPADSAGATSRERAREAAAKSRAEGRTAVTKKVRLGLFETKNKTKRE